MSKNKIRQRGKFRISLEALRLITERNKNIESKKEIQQISIQVLSGLMGSSLLSSVISDMTIPWSLFDSSMQPYTCSAIKKNWIKK